MMIWLVGCAYVVTFLVQFKLLLAAERRAKEAEHRQRRSHTAWTDLYNQQCSVVSRLNQTVTLREQQHADSLKMIECLETAVRIWKDNAGIWEQAAKRLKARLEAQRTSGNLNVRSDYDA